MSARVAPARRSSGIRVRQTPAHAVRRLERGQCTPSATAAPGQTPCPAGRANAPLRAPSRHRTLGAATASATSALHVTLSSPNAATVSARNVTVEASGSTSVTCIRRWIAMTSPEGGPDRVGNGGDGHGGVRQAAQFSRWRCHRSRNLARTSSPRSTRRPPVGRRTPRLLQAEDRASVAAPAVRVPFHVNAGERTRGVDVSKTRVGRHHGPAPLGAGPSVTRVRSPRDRRAARADMGCEALRRPAEPESGPGSVTGSNGTSNASEPVTLPASVEGAVGARASRAVPSEAVPRDADARRGVPQRPCPRGVPTRRSRRRWTRSRGR
jgi:hypothetical protein